MSDSTGDDNWSQLAATLGVDGEAAAPTADAHGSDVPTVDGAPPKRRRRRRSRKKVPGAPLSADAADTAEVDETPAEQEPADDPDTSETVATDGDAAPKKRRRRRSRGTKDGAPEVVNGQKVAVADDEDNAADPVSVSNLPSWQELIDGLYRP